MLRLHGRRQVEQIGWWEQLLQYRLIHGGSVRHFTDIAAGLGVRHCPGPGPTCGLTASEHRRGEVRGDVVHWTERGVTRNGLRSFLKLVARTRLLNYRTMNKAMRIYAENMWANHAAMESFHIRFRSSLSKTDRLQIRWLVGRGMEITDEARRWANRPL
jgi:hypothetical protein